MDSTLLTLALSTGAASAAALGTLPLVGKEQVPTAWLGWSNALAAGMMLGAAYLLTTVQPEGAVPATSIGALLGLMFILGTHRATGTSNAILNRPHDEDPAFGYRILLISGLHAASEGVAIGVGMCIEVEFGVFMALAIALHNVPEGTVLTAILQSRSVSLDQAAGLAVASNIGQVLLAVTTFSVVSAAPASLPWALGFAVGSLTQLVLIELLPESYRQAGQTSIALVTIVALGAVVLSRGFMS